MNEKQTQQLKALISSAKEQAKESDKALALRAIAW
jgi:hypothetical protein